MPAQLDLDLGSVEARSVPKACCHVCNHIFLFIFYIFFYCIVQLGKVAALRERLCLKRRDTRGCSCLVIMFRWMVCVKETRFPSRMVHGNKMINAAHLACQCF